MPSNLLINMLPILNDFRCREWIGGLVLQPHGVIIGALQEARSGKQKGRKEKKSAHGSFRSLPQVSTFNMSRAQATLTVHQPHLQRQRHSGGLLCLFTSHLYPCMRVPLENPPIGIAPSCSAV